MHPESRSGTAAWEAVSHRTHCREPGEVGAKRPPTHPAFLGLHVPIGHSRPVYVVVRTMMLRGNRRHNSAQCLRRTTAPTTGFPHTGLAARLARTWATPRLGAGASQGRYLQSHLADLATKSGPVSPPATAAVADCCHVASALARGRGAWRKSDCSYDDYQSAMGVQMVVRREALRAVGKEVVLGVRVVAHLRHCADHK